ncbi:MULTISPECIES: CpaD family pilus assembly lipoprotein [Pseudomonas]|uniref:Pilus biogenesis CpaD protein (Pilus_cpaD) n=1 Tax=Pseudomonas lutea TaxID=243924 RepID=A0A9X8QJM8_9PSED|nr:MULTISPECIES: CpaD family pilus assembly lipoprotein [Pseudomonas]SEQ56165.1 Pilus biogenesis CpaD protein (pilus_cpaD) [Pseudomonas lutea]
MWIDSRHSLAVLGAAVMLLAGCSLEPVSYASDYVRLADRNGQAVWVPRACLSPETAAAPDRLPMGCANALNLARMIERPSDLQRGRPMGPAMAAPVARAAEAYITGHTADDIRRQQLEQEAANRNAAGM